MKDLRLEWRNKYTFSGILLYMLILVFLLLLSFGEIKGPVWVVLFWIMILFTAVNAGAKSFLQENPGRQLYYYFLSDPASIIFAKICYNVSIMLLLAALALAFYAAGAGFPVEDPLSFFIALFLGAVSFASIFSMISAIASRANNSGTLMTILSFPVLLPVLQLLIRISLRCINGGTFSENLQDLLFLAALDVFVIAMALILFPYLWRD